MQQKTAHGIGLGSLALGALLALGTAAGAETAGAAGHAHGAEATHQGHGHDHDAEAEAIYHGHFDDAQVQPRPLSDWEGDWQSVYPLLLDGTLAPVWDHKAEQGDKTAADHEEAYRIGYVTDVDRILIEGDSVTFFTAEGSLQGSYADDGLEVLTYAAGNRGVRYVFEKTGGDAEAPGFIQFSDHGIAPKVSDHYHLYWGDDRAALLEEVTNWPTYYPASLTGAEVAREMMAH